MKKNVKKKIKPISILVVALSTLATYLSYFKNTYGIDTSTMILSQKQMLDGYLSQGRFGIVWLFHLFIRNYNNQIVPFIVVPLLVLAVIYLYFILKKFDKSSSNFALTLFAIVFINNPVVYSQLYFKMQAIHIVIGLFCVLIGTHLCLSENKNIVKIIGGAVLFGFSLLIYQVFAFFIFSMFLLSMLLFKEKRTQILQSMFPSLVVAGIIYVISYIIASMTINYSSYGTETYMMWNKLGTLGGFQKSGAILMALIALGYAALFVITALRLKSGKKVDRLLLVLLIGSILTFNIAFGNVRPAPRVYFGAFSVVFAAILYLLAKKGGQYKWLAASVTLLSVLFTFGLSQRANHSYDNDVKLTQEVVAYSKANNIPTSDFDKTNVVFLGNLQAGNQGIYSKLQDIFITGATRTSFFQFDPPLTSVRPYDFMKTQGYNFAIPDQALRTQMTTQYSGLPDYPNEKAFTYDPANKTIVVKLSN
ncbi:glucosyltransferase domain-containing protein [Lactococcus taiwanensis]|uniref:glucosyltransferase domain-containing protein n=1 Tax=Lactococcus taiwanensis TaxID=1151742 RepID=UPI001963EEFE|nr:glucosyltransferase domain-containing protein [Lactococcus taiwanensis]QRZ10205.1 glucosyltransferase domain-containing protein [Lactococcus taiwanensis]